QARKAHRPHRRHSADRLRVEHTVPEDTEATRALGYEHVAVGEKRQTPRMHELLCDNDNPERLLRSFKDRWSRGQGNRWRADRPTTRIECPTGTRPTRGNTGWRRLLSRQHFDHEDERTVHEEPAARGHRRGR